MTAALKGLTLALPEASITLLTSPLLAGFAGRYTAFKKIVTVPPYPGVTDGPPDEGATSAFFQEMCDERFDLALQWHGGGQNSNGFVN